MTDDKVITTATGTKKLVQVGHSLTVAVTTEAHQLGLDRGDLVKITLEKPQIKPKYGLYVVQDRETGTKIEGATTYKMAQRLIAKYEGQDRKDGTYTPNFYEIATWDGYEYVPVDSMDVKE